MACTSASIAAPACSATFSMCEIQALKSFQCMCALSQSLVSSAPCVGWTSSPWAACGSPGWAGAGPCSDRISARHALRVSLHDKVMQYMRKSACCYACIGTGRILTTKEQRMGARLQRRSRLCMPDTFSAPIR